MLELIKIRIKTGSSFFSYNWTDSPGLEISTTCKSIGLALRIVVMVTFSNSGSLVKDDVVLLVSTSQVIHLSISTHIWQINEPIHQSKKKVLSILDSTKKSKCSNKSSFSKLVSVSTLVVISLCGKGSIPRRRSMFGRGFVPIDMEELISSHILESLVQPVSCSKNYHTVNLTLAQQKFQS